jgi:SOS-response transcriptional repressor LexA
MSKQIDILEAIDEVVAAEPLTDVQQKALDFITSFIDRHTYGPTTDEIAQGLQYASTNSARKVVSTLVTKNKLRFAIEGQYRSLRVLK